MSQSSPKSFIDAICTMMGDYAPERHVLTVYHTDASNEEYSTEVTAYKPQHWSLQQMINAVCQDMAAQGVTVRAIQEGAKIHYLNTDGLILSK